MHGPEAQLANYFIGMVVDFGLAAFFVWLYFVGIRFHISPNARLALFGLSFGFIHWGIHQTWWGRRWWLKISGDPNTQWYVDNGWVLSFTYILLVLGACITTSAIIKGHFARNFMVQLLALMSSWALVAYIGYRTLSIGG